MGKECCFQLNRRLWGWTKYELPYKRLCERLKKYYAEHLDFTGSEHYASFNFSSGTVLMADDHCAQVTH